MMRVIETWFNGTRFRSRTEARWAVFFSASGIRYEYEKEGYDLGGGVWYLPDFWLPDLNRWFEVKGKSPSKDELEKCRGLALASESEVLLGACPSRFDVGVSDDWRGAHAALASLTRLWAVQMSAHSALTFSMPRNRNCLNPLACLICPNTGSTICFRNR